VKHRLSLGYSTAAAMSGSETDWKEKLRRIGLFLCVLVLLLIFFRYVTHSLDRRIAAGNPGANSQSVINP
jgi:hypothetical protein